MMILRNKQRMATAVALAATLATPQVLAGGEQEGTRGLSIQFHNKAPLPEASQRKAPELNVDQLPDQTKASATVLGGFNLNAVNFSGNTVFSDAELQAVIAPYVGQVTLASDLEDMRLALSQHYIMNGYINSGAILPDQQVNNGSVRFDLVEGTISQVNINGSGRLADSYIERALVPDGPFNKTALQNNFQLLLEDPLFENLAVSLRPSDAMGQAILNVDVERAKAYGVNISYDNHRPVATGDTQARMSGWVRNVTGLGDTLELAAIHREGSDGYDVRFEVPVGLGGLSLGVATSKGKADVIEASVKALNINSDYTSSSVYAVKDIYRELDGHLTMGFELSSREVTNVLLDMPWSFSLGENDGYAKSVAARLNVDYLSKSPKDVLSMRATYSQGLDAMDSTQNADGRPDSDFSSAVLQVQYARMLTESGLQLQLRGSYYWANEGLLPMEQVAMGGANTVRGYRENELVRDKGMLASAQLLYPFGNQQNGLGRWNVLAFADVGKAENVTPTASQTFDQMSSVGLGLQWRYKERVSADLYVAHALEDAPVKAENNLQDDGIHFSLSVAVF